MSAILAVESSTLTASVAVLVDDQLVIERESGVNTHSEALLTLIDECLVHAGLALADLSTIAVGAGPGSFTGLRIGMATVKGLCFAANVPLTPVSSLAALALDCRAQGSTEELVVSVLDARRKEIFVGFFRDDAKSRLRPQAAERVIAPTALAGLVAEHPGQSVVLCGDGACKYDELLSGIGRIDREGRLTPSAGSAARLAQHMPAADLLAAAAPTYVRLPEAEIKFPDGNPGGTFSVEKLAAERAARKGE